jgi:hypothetical protein
MIGASKDLDVPAGDDSGITPERQSYCSGGW